LGRALNCRDKGMVPRPDKNAVNSGGDAAEEGR
jgi:hypothetical protein